MFSLESKMIWIFQLSFQLRTIGKWTPQPEVLPFSEDCLDPDDIQTSLMDLLQLNIQFKAPYVEGGN